MFTDYLFHPLLATATTILIISGFVAAGRQLVGKQAAAIEQAAAYIFVLGCTSTLIHTLSLTHQLHITYLRMIAILFGLFGLWQLVAFVPHMINDLQRLTSSRPLTRYRDQLATIVIGIILVSLFLAALAPATDGDSLDYHLGVPIDWLTNTAAVPRSDWLHAHLIGLGEMINLLGLAAGTSSLGALTQYSGLFILLIIIQTVAHADNLILGRLLVVSSPVLLFLIPNQKPQYILFVATTVTLVLFLHSHQQYDKLPIRIYWLGFGAIAFAIGSKYPLIITGGIVILIGLWVAWHKGQLLIALSIMVTTLLIMAGGVWLRNYLFYGDPLSPFLSQWLTPDNLLTQSFAKHLREYEIGVITWHDYLLFPFRLIMTMDPPSFTSVIGIGAIAFLLADWHNMTTRILILIAIITTVFMVVTNQLTPRFFIEPYLWATVGVVQGAFVRGRQSLLYLLTLQGIVVAMMAIYAAIILFPGTLSNQLRDQTVSRYGSGYEIGRWLDETLPADAIIFTDLRTGAVLPRPFISADIARYWYQVDILPEERRTLFLTILEKYLRTEQATHLILQNDHAIQSPYNQLACLDMPIASATFRSSGRNPFNNHLVDTTYTIIPLNRFDCLEYGLNPPKNN